MVDVEAVVCLTDLGAGRLWQAVAGPVLRLGQGAQVVGPALSQWGHLVLVIVPQDHGTQVFCGKNNQQRKIWETSAITQWGHLSGLLVVVGCNYWTT